MMPLAWPHVTLLNLPGDLMTHPGVLAIEALLFAYFLLVNAIDFALILAALRTLPRFVKLSNGGALADAVRNFATPVSVIVPVFNEQEDVAAVVRSLLEMRYRQFEVIVVNDGSTDSTLQTLTKEFELTPVPEARYVGLKTARVRAIYRSKTHFTLRVLDKENGGKGDALNAGLNEARYPLVFMADGDSLYRPDALEQLAQSFVEDARTVGCGAALQVLNAKPHSMLVRFQEVEYLRSAFISRFALAPFNGIMCISGACALWKKSVLLGAGGYATNMVWEDAEMTVRVHHFLRASKTPYRIAFVPAGVCVTRVPETLGDLRRQRISWQRHITEAVTRHRNMLFRPSMGLIGWFALPAYVFGEWLAPLWLLFGLVFALATAVLGIMSWQAQLALLAVVFAFTALKTASALMLDELAHSEPRSREIWKLFGAAMLEQFGFRQMLAMWALAGMFAFYLKLPIRGRRAGVIGPLEPPYRPITARRLRAH